MMANKVVNRETYEARYKSARGNILLVIALTVLNIVLLVAQSDTYFLFSACVPYLVVDLGMILCGIYPTAFYVDDFADANLLDPSAFSVFLGFAVVVMVLYFLSWLLSKNYKVGWLVFALVFFSLDTAGMLLFFGVQLEVMLDILFHVWVLVSLVRGIRAFNKLKNLPDDETVEPESEPTEENFG